MTTTNKKTILICLSIVSAILLACALFLTAKQIGENVKRDELYAVSEITQTAAENTEAEAETKARQSAAQTATVSATKPVFASLTVMVIAVGVPAVALIASTMAIALHKKKYACS